MDHGKIKKIYNGAGVSSSVIQCYNMYYKMVFPDWITNTMGPYMYKFLRENNFNFVDQQNECDSYALTALTLVKWAWIKTAKIESSVAFGLFGYRPDHMHRGGHVVNTAAHKSSDGKYEIKFYEPQPQTIKQGILGDKKSCLTEVKLTEKEISSCMACLFF